LNDRDSYHFRLPGHCGIFTAETCVIHFACDLIESKPMVFTVDERFFLVAMSRLASNHTGTRAHLQMINVVQDALRLRLRECGLHCALRNELQEKLRAAGIDPGRSIRDILAIRSIIALRLIFEYYSKDMGLHI
jgi:hypothetical protein